MRGGPSDETDHVRCEPAGTVYLLQVNPDSRSQIVGDEEAGLGLKRRRYDSYKSCPR